MEEIRKSLNPVRSMVGDLDLNRGTGLLTMRDTREAVEAADDIIRRQIGIYSRMVTLKFQMIDLTVSDNGEAGVDWNAVLTKALQNVPGFTLSALSPSTLPLLEDVRQGVEQHAGFHAELGWVNEIAVDGKADLRVRALVDNLPVDIRSGLPQGKAQNGLEVVPQGARRTTTCRRRAVGKPHRIHATAR